MPTGRHWKKHGLSSAQKWANLKKSAAARRAAAKKLNMQRRRTTPRLAIKTSVTSSPNVHMFKRSYSFPLSIGVADEGNQVTLNSGSTWMVVKLHTKFNKLPEYLEFKDLFSEYKINSICHKLTPYYKSNIVATRAQGTGADNYGIAIPNYEIFTVPVTSSARQNDFTAMTGAEIESYLNQSQRKGRRLMPSGIQTYWETNPRVSGWKGPASKSGGDAYQVMERATYLNTDPAPLVVDGVDQTNIVHYSKTLLIRRVDGLELNSHGDGSSVFPFMGFRTTVDCFLKLRKVQ